MTGREANRASVGAGSGRLSRGNEISESSAARIPRWLEEVALEIYGVDMRAAKETARRRMARGETGSVAGRMQLRSPAGGSSREEPRAGGNSAQAHPGGQP